MNARGIERLLDDVLDIKTLALECDGLTRLIHRVLFEEGIEHQMYRGMLVWRQKQIYHHWIEIGDLIVDYALRMWFGEELPHGVFHASTIPWDLKYRGSKFDEPPCSDQAFVILTGLRNQTLPSAPV